MNTQASTKVANLLIVDDAPANLELLAGLLRRAGFRVRPVPSGELALQAARHELPDLILLDINMPGLNGYEVCARLKADSALQAVPVIFLSALDDVLDKVKAFSVGGVDYVSKPFQFEEVEARVRTHLALRRQECQLQESLAQLKELETQRDGLVHMIVHDLRSPLSSILMFLDLLRDGAPMEPSQMAVLVRATGESATQMKALITQILDVSRLEAGQMPLKLEPHDLTQTLRTTLESLTALAGKRQVHLQAPETTLFPFDEDLMSRVMTNLLSNAIKFTPPTGEVRVAITHQAECVRVTVTDTGAGIAPEHHQKIFEKFGQAESGHKQVGTGLGLTFCRLAVAAHGGKIGLESQPGCGSTFWFTLPLSPAPPAAQDR